MTSGDRPGAVYARRRGANRAPTPPHRRRPPRAGPPPPPRPARSRRAGRPPRACAGAGTRWRAAPAPGAPAACGTRSAWRSTRRAERCASPSSRPSSLQPQRRAGRERVGRADAEEQRRGAAAPRRRAAAAAGRPRGTARRRRRCAPARRRRRSGGRRASRAPRAAAGGRAARRRRASASARSVVSTISPARNSTKPSRSSTSRRAPGHELQRIAVGRRARCRARTSCDAAAVVLRLAEDAHRVALAEAPVEHRRVLEHHAADAARAVGELERLRNGLPGAGPPALLAQHREGRVDELPGRQVADPDLLRGRRHRASLPASAPSPGTIRARCRPLRAPPPCGRSGRSTTRRRRVRMEDVVAPPYDVITPADRATLLGPQPVQRRAPDPAGRGRRGEGQRPLLPLAARGRAGAGAASRACTASSRTSSAPTASRRTRTRLRSRSCAWSPTTRASCGPHERTYSRPQGRPPAPAARDAGPALAGLRPVRRPLRAGRGGARGRAPSTYAAIDVTDGQGTRHRLWRVTSGHEEVAGRARGLPAADRRRPPPLRDGPRLPRRARGEDDAAGRAGR